MTEPLTDVLYEDNHLLALHKPAGLLSVGDRTGDESMVDVARNYLRKKYNKPGNVFVGVVHRLDRPVSGVLLFARTSKAASRLSDQFRRRSVRKSYLAVVDGVPDPGETELENWLLKDSSTNNVKCVAKSVKDAKHSLLQYRLKKTDGRQSLVIVEPKTGRSHQIRVQLARHGYPIVGDIRYGASKGLGNRILLHSHELEIDHPTRKERLVISCESEFVSAFR